MMKYIKFKAKRKDNQKWVYGDLIHDENAKTYIIDEIKISDSSEITDLYAYEVIPETISQYTGLKDINGVEIYENDIVKFVRNFSKYKCSKNYEFEIYFNTFLCHYALHILDDDSNSYGKNGQFDILTLTGAKVKDLEVIGNICDKEVK